MFTASIKKFSLPTLLALLVIFSYSLAIILGSHAKTDIMLLFWSGEMLNWHKHGYQLAPHLSLAEHLNPAKMTNLAPPFSMMLAAFFAKLLSYFHFFICFTLLGIVLNIIFLARLFRHFYPKTVVSNQLYLYVFILLNLMYMPSFWNIPYGQVAFLLNALTIAAYLSLENKRDITAGCLLAFALNIKIFFGLFFIYLLAQKRYRALLSFTLFTLLFATLPVMIYGLPTTYGAYWTALTKVFWCGVNWNASFYGFLCRTLGDPSHHFQTALFFPVFTKWSYYLIFCFYTCLVYFFSQKKRNQSALAFAFTLSAMLLLSPLGWNYYFPLLITALLINLKALAACLHQKLLIILLALALFISSFPFSLHQNPDVSLSALLLQGNSLFFALLMFNLVSIFQVRSIQNTPTLRITKNISKILLISLLPSYIGILIWSVSSINSQQFNTAIDGHTTLPIIDFLHTQ